MRKRSVLILSLLLALFWMGCHCGDERRNVMAEGETVQYGIGDVILADGSVVHAADLSAVDDQNAPVAVIAGFRDDGAALGVGVYRSEEPLPWALEDSAGYETQFQEIVCTQQSETTFAGDRDGSDNWSAICAQDASGLSSPESYPAFHFVHTYA